MASRSLGWCDPPCEEIPKLITLLWQVKRQVTETPSGPVAGEPPPEAEWQLKEGPGVYPFMDMDDEVVGFALLLEEGKTGQSRFSKRPSSRLQRGARDYRIRKVQGASRERGYALRADDARRCPRYRILPFLG